jgi:hypothetical protein
MLYFSLNLQFQASQVITELQKKIRGVTSTSLKFSKQLFHFPCKKTLHLIIIESVVCMFIGMTAYLWQERREVPGSPPDVTKKVERYRDRCPSSPPDVITKRREVPGFMPGFSTKCDKKVDRYRYRSPGSPSNVIKKKSRGTGIDARVLTQIQYKVFFLCCRSVCGDILLEDLLSKGTSTSQ